MAYSIHPPLIGTIMTQITNAETAVEYARTAYHYVDTTLDTIADQILVGYQTVWEYIPDFQTVVEHVPYHETISGYVPDYQTLVEHVPILEPIMEHVMEPVMGRIPEKGVVQQMFWDNLNFLHTCVKFYYLIIGVLFLAYALLSTFQCHIVQWSLRPRPPTKNRKIPSTIS